MRRRLRNIRSTCPRMKLAKPRELYVWRWRPRTRTVMVPQSRTRRELHGPKAGVRNADARDTPSTCPRMKLARVRGRCANRCKSLARAQSWSIRRRRGRLTTPCRNRSGRPKRRITPCRFQRTRRARRLARFASRCKSLARRDGPPGANTHRELHGAKPVFRTEEVPYTVMVPYQEQRTATRRVCQMVPEVRTCTVMRDRGGWQDVAVNAGPRAAHDRLSRHCRDWRRRDMCRLWPRRLRRWSSLCAATCRVWVSNLVPEQVQYTVMRPQWSEVPYTYNVTLCRPEQRTPECSALRVRRRAAVARGAVHGLCSSAAGISSHRDAIRAAPYSYQVCVMKPETRTRQFQVCRYVAGSNRAKCPTRFAFRNSRNTRQQCCSPSSSRSPIRCAC